jgi:hypothetical protein
MLPSNPEGFFSAILSAGAILAGFCGTFLSFRIQREAAYYRQPNGKGNDTYVGLTHFPASLLLLLLATLCTAAFGIVLPVLALSGSQISTPPDLIVGGIIASLILMAAYFTVELVHYRILRFLPSDKAEWRREGWVVAVGLVGAIISLVYFGCR